MRKIIQPCGFHCIKINNLGVSFGEQTVLEDVNMHIHCGSFNVIIYQNGAGKSTLIKAILGEIPHTGTIEFKDTKDGHMAKLKIGYVPQSVNIEKNTPVSVYDLIASYQYNYPVFLPKSKKIEAKIRRHSRYLRLRSSSTSRCATSREDSCRECFFPWQSWTSRTCCCWMSRCPE